MTDVFDVFISEVEHKKQGTDIPLPYRVDRDDGRIYVDGVLLDILYYGQGDYGFGKDLYLSIHRAMDEIGYYLDFETSGVIIPCEV